MKKKLLKVVDKIVELENRISAGDTSAMVEIENIVENISPDDMIAIDNYINERNLLKK